MSQADIQELKKSLYEKIEAMEDETALQMLNEAVTEYTAVGGKDILDELTPEQLADLKESIAQADRGELIPHEEVMRKSREWLLK